MQRRLAEWARDYEHLFRMQCTSWKINFSGRVFSELDFRVALHSGIEHDEVYVYEQEGCAVGWLWLDQSSRQSAHIRHIQVEQDHWGQGLGRQILEDAIAMARASGRHTITLTVTKSNDRALSLYTHLGFVKVEDQGARQRMSLAFTAPLA
jgi:ribosomal protein S18 acetylase RimI-like enzyme